MPPGDSSAFGQTAGRRGALLVTTAAYADPRQARPSALAACQLWQA
jgi:hypothetical protein